MLQEMLMATLKQHAVILLSTLLPNGELFPKFAHFHT